MNLVKWLRKNNRKVMAVVVVLIMISFVLGAALQQLSRRFGYNPDKAVYTFDGGDISSIELNMAEAELNVLAALGAGEILLARNMETGRITQRSISALLLHQMLFPGISKNVNLNYVVKQMVRQNQLGFSEGQIDRFFNQTSVNPTLHWLLLKNEAKKYGITVMTNQAEEMINKSGLAGRVATMAKNSNLTSEDVYQALADFSAVRILISTMCGGDNTTITQIQNIISDTRETFSYEFVRFPASMFVDEVEQPSETEIKEHFEKYKDNIPGNFTDDNPFGFGYKLPDMVKLEYVLIDLDEIREKVGQVSEGEAEQFYQQNLDQMVMQVPSDPNDPNSPMTTQTLRYSQVVNTIKAQIKRNKVQALAEEIINSIRDTAAASFEDIQVNEADVNELKAKAESYGSIAKLAQEKFEVSIESGTTSYVSATDLGNGSVLGNMAIVQGQKAPVSLLTLLFSIEPLSDAELFDVQKPHFYENIGMLRDGSGQRVALVRIIGAEKAHAPASVDTKVKFEMPYKQGAEPIDFTIREKVVENLKLAKAYEIAVKQAGQFAENVKEDNWQSQLDKLNAEYVSDVNDSNAVELKLDKMTDRSRITQIDIEMAKAMSKEQDFGEAYLKQAQSIKKLLDEIYDLHDQKLPAVIGVKADGGVYVIKDVTVNRLNVDEYNQAKLQMSMVLDERARESCSLFYLMPENLTERMKFEVVQQDKQTEDANDINDVNTSK